MRAVNPITLDGPDHAAYDRPTMGTLTLSATARLEATWASAAARPVPWLVGYALLLTLQVGPWWYATPDSVVYLSTARSLAETGTLRALGSPQLGYPPGYALLLSPAFLVDERPFLVIAVLHVALALLLLAGVYRWTRRVCAEAAVFVTGLVMVNVSLWIQVRRPLSELAFMTGLVWSAALLDEVLRGHGRGRRTGTAVSAATLVVATTLVREAGLSLVGGYLLGLAAGRGARAAPGPAAMRLAAALAVVAAACVVGFAGYELAMLRTATGAVGTHLDGLGHILTGPASLAEGLRLRISEVGRLLIPGMFKSYARGGDWVDVNLAIYGPFAVALTIGWWRLVRRHVDVLALALPPYIAMYIVWAFDNGTRYMLPMLPVLAASLWYVIEPWRRVRFTVLAGFLLGHAAVAIGYWLWVDLPRARECARHWSAVTGLADAARTRPGTVAAWAVPDCGRLMFEFALDRRVMPITAATADGLVPDAVLVPAGTTLPGFRTAHTAAGFALVQRDGAR